MPELVRADECDLSGLVDRARRLAAPPGRAARSLLGLAGAPGVGKSTVAAALMAALAPDAVLVPLDGFHLAEAELHRLGRHRRKGAPDTFDAAGYVNLLRRLRAPEPETVYAPRFDRHQEEPVAGAVPVPPELPLVVTEGNYLLVETGPWAAVRGLLDEVWFLVRDETERLDRLTARHAEHGRSPVEAAARARGTDQHNADLVATTRHRADLIVELVSPGQRASGAVSCGGAGRG
ncbi:MAG: nucleoside/nucleotide kinase family protein [Micromonosporaceae bacterium]|nr:nucleoside/nucleotide kinase family protein [Micromonosporaceae bacterium]